MVFKILPLIHRDQTEVELVLALEHHLLLGHLQKARRAEWGAECKKGQRWVLRFPILSVEDLNPPADVQTLHKNKNQGKFIFWMGNERKNEICDLLSWPAPVINFEDSFV